jgi:hypothetical protein
MKRFEASTAAPDCEARFPAKGTLSVKLHLPKTGDLDELGGPAHMTAVYGGVLSGTPLGNCMEAKVAETILVAPLPTLPVGGAVLHHDFEFPRKAKDKGP